MGQSFVAGIGDAIRARGAVFKGLEEEEKILRGGRMRIAEVPGRVEGAKKGFCLRMGGGRTGKGTEPTDLERI